MKQHKSQLQEDWQAFKERTRKSDKQINKPEQTFTKDICLLIARQVVANNLHPSWRG